MILGKRKGNDCIREIRNTALSTYPFGSEKQPISYYSFKVKLVLLPAITPLILDH